MGKKDGSVSQRKLQRVLQIHRLLRTRRSYPGSALEEACREIDPEVTTRTVASDIAFLRDVLGAPIPERSNKWTHYRYEEDYSLFEGLDDSFTGALNEVLAVVRQLSRKKEFSGLEDLLLRLEQRASLLRAEGGELILFDEPELQGRQHLLPLYRHMLEGHSLSLIYAPFAKAAQTFPVKPCLLKDYNGRWFLFAWRQGRDNIQQYPLDRIVSYEKTDEVISTKAFNVGVYFRQMLGVTCDLKKPEAIPVTLRFNAQRGKYVVTKKIHPDQQEEVREDGSVLIRFSVLHNHELETKILEFGPDVEVLEPPTLRASIAEYLRKAIAQYD